MEKMRKKCRTLPVLLLLAALLSTSVLAAAPRTLVPVGKTVGIRLESRGLMVVGFDREGASAARDAGMKKGDVITRVEGRTVTDTACFRTLVADSDGGPLDVTVSRGGREVELEIEPQKDEACYRLGILVRDSIAGIGTVTFYDPATGVYGALGHGVSDAETMTLLPLREGQILPASVSGVRRGESGTPGVLRGKFDTSAVLGSVDDNTEHGIFGRAAGLASADKAVPVASAGEIRTGKVTILANVSGDSVCAYEAEITRLFPLERESGRNMLLKITDERLLAATGGIVQGMSGSPILQDGRLIGAVTHVLVNNPTRGYGIFLENMLENCAIYQ